MAAAASKKKGKGKDAAGDDEKEIVLGRPGNSVRIGIVGLPNVGKSSMFNLLGKASAPAENYSFCTKEPNHTRAIVPDKRYDFLVEAFKPKSRVPAVLHCTDIAGLVKGANEGQGLGNAFLANIQAVDAVYHMCRAFKDTSIEHVEGSVDPVRDLEIIQNELRLKDLAWLKTEETKLAKLARGKSGKNEDLATVRKAIALLTEEKKDIRFGEWGPKEVPVLNRLQLLTAKPAVFLVNISRAGFVKQRNKFLPAIKAWVKEHSPGSTTIPFSVAFEQEVAAIEDPEERKKFLADAKVPSMVPRIILAGYKVLRLINFFTCGADEVRAWTVRKGSKAPQAAGVIHGDFEKGFVCAETMAYADFEEHGSEMAVRSAGKYITKGRNYVVEDGDIMFFKTTAKTKKR